MNKIYPNAGMRQMAELAAFERQLHALIPPLLDPYGRSNVHDIGMALKQAQLLAHDIEYMAGDLYRQYEEAEVQEEEDFQRQKLLAERVQPSI